MELKQIQVKWAIFIALSVFAPCFHFLLLMYGFVPLIFIIFSSIRAVRDGEIIVFALQVFHCLVYVPTFYGASSFLTKTLFRIKSSHIRHALLLVVATSFALMAMLPIHTSEGGRWTTWIVVMGYLLE